MLARLRPNLAWRPARNVVISVLIGLVILLPFVWNLGGQPAHLSPSEQFARQTSNLSDIATNPIYAPWRLIQCLLLQISSHSQTLMRLPSVIFAVGYLFAFYWLLKGWFGRPIAALSAILLGVTPLYLLLGRDGTPLVMNLAPIIVMAAYVWLVRSDGEVRAWIGLFVALILSLYTPGMVWLLVFALIANRKSITDNTEYYTRKTIASFCLLLILALSPLILAFVRHPQLLNTYFMVPGVFSGAQHILSSWGWMMLSLSFKTQQHEVLILGRLPILNVAQTGLVVFGGYVMWDRLRSYFFWIVGAVIFICLMAGLNDTFYTLAMALPLLAILVGMGLRYLFIEWIHVFPRNPLPRYFAICLMAALVVIHVLYGLRYGLVAWPHSLAVSHLYVLK